MNVASLKVKPDLQRLTVRVVVPRAATWRIRVGVKLMELGARVAGYGLKVQVYGEPT